VKITINNSQNHRHRPIKRSNTPPIILANKSADAYLYPEEPILLHQNGDIICKDKVFQCTSRTYFLRSYYSNFFEYLKRKKMPLNVAKFRKKDLGDILEEMRFKKRNSITYKRLSEIYSRENQIARLRNVAIDRLKKIEYKRWWREYNKMLDNNNYKVADKMRTELDEKSRVARKVRYFQ